MTNTPWCGSYEMLDYIVAKAPGTSRQVALDLLLSCEADADKVLALLDPVRGKRIDARQSTLKRMLTRSSSNGNKKAKSEPGVTEAPTQEASSSPRGKSPMEASKSPNESPSKPGKSTQSTKGTKQKAKRATVLHIYDPEIAQQQVPEITVHLNVFPKQLADRLLKTLLDDCGKWHSRHFYLFNRLVQSQHTTATYSSNKNILEKRDATYQGVQVSEVFPYTDAMEEAGQIVRKMVNAEIEQRGRHPLQHQGEWDCDVVLANCYAGRTESVGYHSDQLTHIGPQAVIASISLGVTREFRLLRRKAKGQDPDNPPPVISLHLPHNCMVVMHGGCQELYKHSIVPTTKPLSPHSLAGDKRINLTYRMYRDDYTTDKLPRCNCDRPMLLRTSSAVAKTATKPYKYIWQCASEYSTNKGCNKIVYLDW